MAKFSDYSPAVRFGLVAAVISYVGIVIMARTLGMAAVPTLTAIFVYPLLWVPLARSLEIRQQVEEANTPASMSSRSFTSLGLGAPPPRPLGGRLTVTGQVAFMLAVWVPRAPIVPEPHGSGEVWVAASWAWWMVIAAFIAFVVPRWTVRQA